jgi:hypothetical protein
MGNGHEGEKEDDEDGDDDNDEDEWTEESPPTEVAEVSRLQVQ